MKTTYLAHLSVKAVEEEEDGKEIRRIRGIASTGTPDRAKTWVNPKTLVKAAKMFDRRNGKMFWNHSWAIPIGRREKVEIVDDKLIFQGVIGHGFPVPIPAGFLQMPVLMNVDDLWNIIKQDLTTSLSIAFNADEVPGEIVDEKSGKRGPTRLDVTDLLEVSVVTIPANPDCEFAVTRAMDDPFFSAAQRRDGTRPPSREELWGMSLDGAAAAAAVGLDDADQDEGADPLEQLDETGHESWTRVNEELEKCRLSLRTRS